VSAVSVLVFFIFFKFYFLISVSIIVAFRFDSALSRRAIELNKLESAYKAKQNQNYLGVAHAAELRFLLGPFS
jgi:hypothetical protein